MNDLIKKSTLGYSQTALFLVSLNFSALDSMKGGFLTISYENYNNDRIEGIPTYTATIVILDISKGEDTPGRKWGVFCYFCKVVSKIVWRENVPFELRLAFYTSTRINSYGNGEPAQLDIEGTV